MLRRASVLLLIAAALLLTGCTAAVSGRGSVGLPTGAPGPGGQPPGGNTAPAKVDCPSVVAPAVGLSFRCVTNGITQTADPLWPLNLVKQVETGWVLAEGAGRVTVPAGTPLKVVATAIRNEMVDLNSWGPNPGVRTVADKARTVAGVHGWLLQTTFTIDKSFRRSRKLHVRTERMWLVVLPAGNGQLALWYVTLPDDAKALWPGVPKLIDSIRLR